MKNIIDWLRTWWIYATTREATEAEAKAIDKYLEKKGYLEE